ncbi:hypothetical protein Syun_007123 [Stephania yunnanensis]|uniref:Inositol polyphosphate-related phosphatase domain-containing protein n=1 Tax=Stephania yunnanensis TaxID=152371 RepID=A0AAP0KXW1_9MAGN
MACRPFSEIIWLGDLNYRLASSCSDTHELLQKNDWQALLEKDHNAGGGRQPEIGKTNGGLVVLLLHGFPELWYTWRHQIVALAVNDYRAVALDFAVPVKFIVGDLDLTYNSPGVKEFIHGGGLKKYVPLLEEVIIIQGTGHFINEEKVEINRWESVSILHQFSWRFLYPTRFIVDSLATEVLGVGAKPHFEENLRAAGDERIIGCEDELDQ